MVKRISIFACLLLIMTSLSVIHIQAAVEEFSLQHVADHQSNPILVLSIAVISFFISFLFLSNLKNKRRIHS